MAQPISLLFLTKGKNRQLGVEIADGVDEVERVDLVTTRDRRVQRLSRFDL